MPLATDELLRKADTSTTTLAALIPKIWAARVERNLRKMAVFLPSLLENTDLMVPGAGDTVYIPSLPDLGASSALTEGTPMTVGALSTAVKVDFTPAEVGTAIGITRKALDRIGYDGVAETLDRLTYAMTQKIEGDIAALYNKTVPTVGGAMTSLYPNNHATGTIVAGDTMSSDFIMYGLQTLAAANNVPFDDGYYRLFIGPKQYRDLIADQNVRNDLRYGQPAAIFRNEVGVLHGCRIIVNNFNATANEGASNLVPTTKNMLVAPRWAAVAWKRRPELVVDPTLYDFGRRRQFAIIADYDIQMLHNERGVVLVTA